MLKLFALLIFTISTQQQAVWPWDDGKNCQDVRDTEKLRCTADNNKKFCTDKKIIGTLHLEQDRLSKGSCKPSDSNTKIDEMLQYIQCSRDDGQNNDQLKFYCWIYDSNSCKSGDIQIGEDLATNGICVKKIPNCNTQTKKNVCDECESGYSLSVNRQHCHKLKNCAQNNSLDSGKCQLCINGYDKGKNCEGCTSGYTGKTCNKCAYGYTWGPKNGVKEKPRNSVCVPKISNCSIQSGTTCTTCTKGYFANNTKTTCTQAHCGNGYYLKPLAEGCTRCDNFGVSDGITCKTCASNQVANSDFNSCVNCKPGTEPDAYKKTCTPCPAGTYSKDGGTCTVCSVGQYSSTGSSTCSNCPAGQISHDGKTCVMNDPNCESGIHTVINNGRKSYSCAKCKNGYGVRGGFVPGGSYTPPMCTACGDTQKTSSDGGACVCKDGYTRLELRSQTCTKCNGIISEETCYAFIPNCIPGKQIRSSCSSCINNFTGYNCTSCKDGYKKSDDGKSCVPKFDTKDLSHLLK